MLKLNEKIEYFRKQLLIQNNSYADNIKEEIYDYFFQDFVNEQEINESYFLNFLTTYEDIVNQIDLIVSKIIMHEHHAGMEELVLEYLVSSEEDVAMLRLKELADRKVKTISAEDIWKELNL